jgi:hypothetical protein
VPVASAEPVPIIARRAVVARRYFISCTPLFGGSGWLPNGVDGRHRGRRWAAITRIVMSPLTSLPPLSVGHVLLCRFGLHPGLVFFSQQLISGAIPSQIRTTTLKGFGVQRRCLPALTGGIGLVPSDLARGWRPLVEWLVLQYRLTPLQRPLASFSRRGLQQAARRPKNVSLAFPGASARSRHRSCTEQAGSQSIASAPSSTVAAPGQTAPQLGSSHRLLDRCKRQSLHRAN